MEKFIDKLIELGATFGPKVIGALLVLLIGLWVIKAVTKGVKKLMTKRNTNESLKPFIISMLNIGLKAMLVVSVLGMVGIQMTSFIAIIGAAGLAVGMALSGSLQNFAGGVMILIFKPFKVSDVLEAQGYLGIVKEIQIFNTIMTTFDNKTIIIPNGGLSTGSMTNYSTEELRRVDWTFGIAYGDDSDKAKEVMMKLIESNDKILKDPAPFIALSGLGDSSVNFAVRAWVIAPNYWEVFFWMNEQVYKTFSLEGLNIPFPQMDVHVHN